MPLTFPPGGAASPIAAFTSGTLAGITAFGLRDTSAAFDLSLVPTSTTPLTAARSITLDANNASHTLKFTAASTVTFPSGTNTLAVLAGNAFIGANTTTLSALGTTPTAALSLINSTAAAAGAQQYSPGFILQGSGWKTDATAASQTIAFRQSVRPIEDTSIARASWHLDFSRAGAAYLPAMSITEVFTFDYWDVKFGATSSSKASLYAFDTLLIAGFASSFGTQNLTLGGGSGLIVMNTGADMSFGRVAANIFGVRNGTTGQTLQVFGTWTDDSNYVRASLAATSTTVTLAAQTAGTGADDINLTLTAAGTGIVNCTGTTGLGINGTKVIGAQGAAVADATDAPSAITQLNDLLARLRTHGLIAT